MSQVAKVLTMSRPEIWFRLLNALYKMLCYIYYIRILIQVYIYGLKLLKWTYFTCLCPDILIYMYVFVYVCVHAYFQLKMSSNCLPRGTQFPLGLQFSSFNLYAQYIQSYRLFNVVLNFISYLKLKDLIFYWS